jgi:ribosomal protein S18 acetylase RimI-like enzyme
VPAPPAWTIVSASALEPRSLQEHLVQTWGDEAVAARGELMRPAEMPGFVALAEGGIVGHAAYRFEGSACYLVSIDSQLPRVGVGSALLLAVESAARSAGCGRLVLDTTNDNLEALRFYQRRGFRIVAVRPGAVDEARRTLKPTIPEVGSEGIAMRDELTLEKTL